MKFKAVYTDTNDARNEVELSAKTETGAKRQATSYAPAMNNITLYEGDRPIFKRSSWRNPNGIYGLDNWEKI